MLSVNAKGVPVGGLTRNGYFMKNIAGVDLLGWLKQLFEIWDNTIGYHSKITITQHNKHLVILLELKFFTWEK